MWNNVPLDCTGKGGPVKILQATYGLPLGEGAKCTPSAVPIGNLNAFAGTECDGKEKCTVSNCPCTAGTTCPPGVTCDPNWVDPARSCPKGMTVTYRCGDASWGWTFLALLAVGCGSYAGAGVVYAQRVQGRKATGGGNQALLRLHPHFGKWAEVFALMEDGVAYVSGRRATRTGPPESLLDETQKTSQGHGLSGQKKEKKEKKEKRDKKERGKRPEKVESKQVLLDTAGSSPTPASTDCNAGRPKATASGGGGRWVHVPT